MPEEIPPSIGPEHKGDALVTGVTHEDVREVLDRFRGHRRHALLSSFELTEMVYNMRIRIAGFTADGNKKPYAEDVELFQRLERRFTAWLDALQLAAAERPADSHVISPAMHAAIQAFHTQGGHAGLMSDAQILDLMSHGVVAFAELEVRRNLYITVGSIAMRSQVPMTQPPGPDDQVVRHPGTGLHPLWPQYDLRDTSFFPQSAIRTGQVDASGIALLCRTSVLDAICTGNHAHELPAGESLPAHLENRSLRRLGIGGALKVVAFGVAQDLGSTEATFNIGTVGIPGQKSLNINNLPSSEHNNWASAYGWRHAYFSILCPDVHMYWRTYLGSLGKVTDGFIGPHGILTEKGWDPEDLLAARRQGRELIGADDRHAPWMEQ